MRITWYGHAAFRVEAAGLAVILDPYRSPDSGGYRPIDESADVVVVSHENDRYHSHLGQIRPPFEVLRALGLPSGGRDIRGVRFEAIPCFETPDRRPEDRVTIVHFRAEGLHVVHLGDLGHDLSDDELAPLVGADLVMVPAGGPPTIALDRIPPLLDAIGPRWVLPMHYKTPGINLNIRPLGEFLERFPSDPIDRPGGSVMDVHADGKPEARRIVCLESAR